MVPSTIDYPHVGIITGYKGFGDIDLGDCGEWAGNDYYYN